MGGGDLNMKKSWHPLLHVNQERVWKQEKKALEERKKLQELRRERQQEREMQELQRLQEEAGGKKPTEKLDWMYATPAAQGGPSANELEDYLLGKKRVDKILKGDEAQKVSKTDQSSFISLQNANTSRDTAAKIREDPMFAIKQQEQAAYEALLRDPTRLRQMRLKAGLEVSEGESKEERRRRKEEKRRQREEKRSTRHEHSDRDRRDRSESRDRTYSSTRSRRDRPTDDYSHGDDRTNQHRYPRDEQIDRFVRHPRDPWDHSRDRFNSRSRPHSSHHDGSQSGRETRRYEENRSNDRALPLPHSRRSRSRSPPRQGNDHRSTATVRRDHRDNDRSEDERSYRPRSRLGGSDDQEAERTKEAARKAKLEQMMSNAKDLDTKRGDYLARVKEEESAAAAREEELRAKLMAAKSKGSGDGKGSFLLDQQRKVFGDGTDLAERLRRGRGGLQRLD